MRQNGWVAMLCQRGKKEVALQTTLDQETVTIGMMETFCKLAEDEGRLQYYIDSWDCSFDRDRLTIRLQVNMPESKERRDIALKAFTNAVTGAGLMSKPLVCRVR